ncbi:MAG: hypothetical protein A3F72_07330 [Bacteroidetes bacterium RIFCSPLOWO2_12_FULL_35_15]|nr:MAG: hypothetical protein A3F72_07330 [Bacteroidetes bacterium RIFCSPLOWO2_12_FULL_35_15]
MKRLLLILLLFFSIPLISQTNYPINYFASPVNVKITLAGNFGEIRPNHFHAGFDIKTNNKEGMSVYAAADGYISRIKTSPYGYGKALYITHPNGYTSVYGHLLSFDKNIAAYCKTIQYAKESFEIDTLLQPNALLVKKGDLIALSGNTGGSQGPHLHFEIRETSTEKPVNPYFFGYKVDDTIKPTIKEIAIYPLGETASINGKQNIKKIKPVLTKGKYAINKLDSITVNGAIGFGIECFDKETGATGPNGVFSIELQSGGKRIYYHELEKFSFENARYVNAHIDFAEKQKHNDVIQKCFLAKNDQLTIYKNIINNGVLNFTDDSVHWIKFIVKDFVGNSSELMLKVRSTSKIKNTEKVKSTTEIIFDCLKENQFKNEEILITIPAFALYDDLKFIYSKSASPKGTYSNLIHIQNDETPLQKAFSLSIKAINLPDALQTKAAIISINKKGKKNYEGGSCNNSWVTTPTKVFGNFAIIVDTIAPRLKLNLKDDGLKPIDLRMAKAIEIIAKDELSGIKKYRASIDGKWVLCEYELKKDLLFFTFDETVSSGIHTFKIEVRDDKNNLSVLQFTFKR